MTGIENVYFYTKTATVHLFWDNYEVYVEDVLVECIWVCVYLKEWENEREKRKVSYWVIIFLSTGSWTNLPQIGALSVYFSKYREWTREETDVFLGASI